MDIASLVETKTNPNIPKISPGDTARVSVKVVEGERERIQVFQHRTVSIRHRRLRRRSVHISFSRIEIGLSNA